MRMMTSRFHSGQFCECQYVFLTCITQRAGKAKVEKVATYKGIIRVV